MLDGLLRGLAGDAPGFLRFGGFGTLEPWSFEVLRLLKLEGF